MLASGPRTGRLSGITGSGFCRSAIRLRTTALHRRQLDLARTVKHQQQSAANHVAQRAIGLLPLPGFTEFAR